MCHPQRGVDKVEPFWWSLFGAGGVVAAMLVPAHILLQNLLGLFGLPVASSDYDRARRLLVSPAVRLYVLVLTVLPLFHWAHRFRYYLMDLGILGARRAIARACYGCAVAGTLGAIRTLVRTPGKE